METRSPFPSQLGALGEGLRLLLRRPAATAGLLALSVLLGILAPWLQIRAGHPQGELAGQVFGLAAGLPLGLYFQPLWIAALDAELRNDPGNPADGWFRVFETRWIKAFVLALGLSVITTLLLFALIIPGVVFVTAFGWAWYLVLLRGLDPGEALQRSRAWIGPRWPRFVQAGLLVLVVNLLAAFVLPDLLLRWVRVEAPDAWLQLRHPAFRVADAVVGLLNLWTSATFLALFHRLEDQASSEPVPESSSR